MKKVAAETGEVVGMREVLGMMVVVEVVGMMEAVGMMEEVRMIEMMMRKERVGMKILARDKFQMILRQFIICYQKTLTWE